MLIVLNKCQISLQEKNNNSSALELEINLNMHLNFEKKNRKLYFVWLVFTCKLQIDDMFADYYCYHTRLCLSLCQDLDEVRHEKGRWEVTWQAYYHLSIP